jgi:4'-phosphopantetheinyl transferase
MGFAETMVTVTAQRTGMRGSAATADRSGLDGAPRVWLLDLADAGWDVDAAAACLSAEELARAERAVPRVRRRRLLIRAGLRRIVGGLVEQPPERVVIDHHNGRPVLADSHLEVSCSANGDLALLAIADGPVGVDISSACGETLSAALLEGWLAVEEAQAVAGLPARDRSAALGRCWAQKEAVLKAEGVGLARDPRTVVTPVADHGAAGPWWLAAVPVPHGHVAALATPVDHAPVGALAVERLLPGGAR